MKNLTTKIAACSASLLLLASAQGQTTVWQQAVDYQDDWGPSQMSQGTSSVLSHRKMN